MTERERLARKLEEIAQPGETGDPERIVAYALRYGSETMSNDAALAEARDRLGESHRPEDNGSGPDRDDQDALAVLEGSRVDLIERIRDGIPEREYVPGCEGLLIRGKRYLVYSPCGVGKTIGMLIVGVESVRQGGTVVIIDVENGADEYARRLELIIGDDPDLAAACSERLRYYEYPALSLEWGEEEWVWRAGRLRPGRLRLLPPRALGAGAGRGRKRRLRDVHGADDHAALEGGQDDRSPR
jgi:hypothetical protein